MTYDYFYGQQAEMFAFYRVPKVLFTEDCFWNVSTDAKLLYGILLDRMNLSARNGWLDEEGRVYIIFTIEEIKGALGCAEKKAVKLLDELEKKCGLIERKRQGLGKPNLIYVKNFISGSVERQFLNCQKDNSGVVKNTIQELSKAQCNNTDSNYIDLSDTDPFFPSVFCGKEVDETDKFTRYYQYFCEQLSMDYLKQDYPYDHEILDLILHLIIEVMCSNRKQIRIASDDKPIEIVKSSFMKLDSEHIRFVMSSFKENTTDVRNIKQYLLASIYNAPYTISAHYDARLTARSIIAGIRKYLQHREKVKARKGTRDTAVHGKQSVKQLLGQNQGATNVEIDKDGIRDFERLAKKYGVDFAVRKDKSVDPPRYLVFVRSKDADALDAICKEHQARSLTKDKKPSVLAQLKKFKEMVAAIPRKVREKKQERDL